MCCLDPGLFQLDPEWLFGSLDGDCGLRACRQDVAEQGSDISATELEPSASLGCRFSGHPFFDDSVRQTAEKSDVFLGFVDSVSSGTSLLASRAVSGMQLRGTP